ncbi:uncharacterized protein EAE98_009930 [Botrytis deweyae]|uniref:Ubiquitin-like protease family profile domain-containing protein n=1 Tax=Botrytis deweyae TaxID=2478750 RepID=A0ABQ7IAP2_9HELO|nr:uncharacterized protein EAE98_009930 [Botrytis deweyae]KAF7917902.1 hypothetical protein EAE98_009930 [Botrytis deweyae]
MNNFTRETFPTGNPAHWWYLVPFNQDGKSYWVTRNHYCGFNRQITTEEQKLQRDWQRKAPEETMNVLTKGFQNQWPTIHDKVEVNDGVEPEKFNNWAIWSKAIWRQIAEDRRATGVSRPQAAATNSSNGH